MGKDGNAWFVSIGCSLAAFLVNLPAGTGWSQILTTPQRVGALALGVLSVFNAAKSISARERNEREGDSNDPEN